MKFRLSYIFFLLFSFTVGIPSWAQNTSGKKTVTEKMTVTIDGTNLKSLISDNGYTTNSVTFNLTGDNSMSYNSSNSYVSMGSVSKTAKNFSIALKVPANYTIESIKSVSVRAVGYTSWAGDNISLTINGGSKTNIRTIAINPQNSDGNYTTVTSSNISSKSTVGLSFISNANDKKIYIRKVIIELEVSTFYNYSATAISNNEAYGNTSTEVTSENTTGLLSSVPVSHTATFIATPNTGYAFAGWGTSADATTYESTDNPYTPTITNGTPGSTANKTLYAIFKHLPMFYFAANSPDVTGGTASANVESATVMGLTLAQTSATTTATFTATPQNGYEFQGWGTSQSASTYESTDNPYTATLTNNIAESEVTKTLYAIFKPVFNFSASATSSNGTLGTATATVANAKILGDVNATQAQTTATFTATPADDCIFRGWYEASDYSGEPVSTNATYNVTLTNATIGSTASKTLYALFKKKQNLQWADQDLDLNLVNGHEYSTAATVTSGKTITYTSDNHNAVTIDADGTIHAVGLGDAHVTASVPGDDIYQQETITRDFSVGEIKQATFTPAWGEGTSTDIKVDGSTSIALTNIANDATFSISASQDGIISWTRSGNTLTISAVKAGSTTLTLSQQGSAVLAGNQVAYTITVSKYPNTFTLADETKAMKVDDVWENVVTAVGNDNTTVSYSTEGIASYDAATNKITALAEGSAVITFTQEATANNEGVSKSINVTVTKVVNTLNVTLASTEMNVDGTINLVVSGRVSDGATHAIISDTQLSSAVNNGTDVITYANEVITARNAGTAKIKFTQDATAKYTAYESETYTITVNKIGNVISVTLNGEQKNSKNIGREETISLGYSSSSSGAYSINLISGSDDIATISNNTITPGDADGTNIWEISQAETYNYAAATTTVRVKVNSVAEEEGYVYTGWTDGSEYSWSTISGTDALPLNGPGETFIFQAKATAILGVWNSTNFYAQYSTNGGSSWTTDLTIQLPDKDKWYDFSCTVPENTTHVRLLTQTGATGNKQVRNLKVTRKTYVRATATQTNLGEVYTDKTASTTFQVSYSSTNGGNIEVISNNPRFTVDTENISVKSGGLRAMPGSLADTQSITVDNHSDNVSDPVLVTLTYTPDAEHLGTDEATVTISDRYYSTELSFTAFAKKYSTSITRGSNQATETTVDGTIDNAFAFTGTSEATPSASSDDDFYYTIASTYTSDVHTEEGVITYDPATNTITGHNAGTAKLIIYQKSTDSYAALSQTFDFSVSKLENPVSIALSTNTINVEGTSNIALTNDDGKGTISVAYSNISFTNEALNREGGLLEYNAETNTLTGINAGSATVTVTQAETHKYLAKSEQFTVNVNKLEQTLVWDREVETSMQIGTVIENNTAHSEQELTPVTYTSSNTAAISVDAESGRITANAVGANITISANQAGNYKYAAASITRQFSVFNRQTPAFIPDEGSYNPDTKTITVGWESSTSIVLSNVGTDADEGFSIAVEDGSVISAVRGTGDQASVLTITGLKLDGSTTLTLTQTANDDFIAKTATYTVNVVMPENYLVLEPETSFNIEENSNYRKIFFNRNIPAGLNTIVLPFDITISELGADKAYTFANVGVVDGGYNFYFKELEADAALEAGVPYVISCSTSISDKVFTGESITVYSAAELEDKAITVHGSWSIVANLEASMNMEGCYGVVNNGNGTNAIMLGGAGSTLNAYSAYFKLTPAAAGASTAVSTKASAAEDIPAGAIPLFTIPVK